MKKIFNLNLGLLIILILFFVLSINKQVNATNSYKGINPNTHGAYDEFHEYALKQVRIEAQRITDSILDSAEKAGVEPKEKLGIKPEDFIKRYSSDLSNLNIKKDPSSIIKLLNILPNQSISFTVISDIQQHLQDYYEREYLRKKRGLNALQNDFVTESLVSQMGNNIYTLESSIIELLEKIGNLLDTKNPVHKAYYEKIKDLKSRKTHKPFPPRSIGPDPNAAAHKLSTGVQGDNDAIEKSIEEVPLPPKERIVSEDFGEKQLARALKLPDEENEEERLYNLRWYFTTTLESNIESSLKEYYENLEEENKFISNVPLEEMLNQRDKIIKGEDKIIETEINNFLFSRTLRDLEIRHMNISNALDDILTATNQIMQLHSIEKDYTKSASNFMPMF